jgi:hypothetical protein
MKKGNNWIYFVLGGGLIYWLWKTAQENKQNNQYAYGTQYGQQNPMDSIISGIAGLFSKKSVMTPTPYVTTPVVGYTPYGVGQSDGDQAAYYAGQLANELNQPKGGSGTDDYMYAD